MNEMNERSSPEIVELLERAEEYLGTITNKGNCGPHHLVSDLAYALRASQSATPTGGETIDDVPSCGQENDYKRARSSAGTEAARIVTVKVPDGYDSVWDFLNDCGLESVQPSTHKCDAEDGYPCSTCGKSEDQPAAHTGGEATKSAPVFSPSRDPGERLPSGDAAGAGADTRSSAASEDAAATARRELTEQAQKLDMGYGHPAQAAPELEVVRQRMKRLKETECRHSGQMDETLLYGLHGAVKRYLDALALPSTHEGSIAHE